MFSAPAIRRYNLLFITSLVFVHSALSQNNSYPATGNALIGGQTIGNGSGSNTDNTALGTGVLSHNTAWGNLGAGPYALAGNTGGYLNVGLGYNSLTINLNGYSNTAAGGYSLTFNDYGNLNTAFGAYVLESNRSGSTNAGFGTYSLNNNSTGFSNVAAGDHALFTSSSASNLVAVGDSALFYNTALYNTAVGSKTLFSTTTGTQNTAIGYQGLYHNTTGYGNTSAGSYSLYNNQTGANNAAFGSGALESNTTGLNNTATGTDALLNNNSGSYNTGSGCLALYYASNGSYNSAFGFGALMINTPGSSNTAIGAYSNISTGGLNNATALGYNAVATASNSVAIGNSSVTSIGGYASWTNFSDGRFKKNINRNVPGLSFINKLVPITYTLDVEGIEAVRQRGLKAVKRPERVNASDPTDDPVVKQAMKEKSAIVYTGFVAQDVYAAARSVGYDFSGVDKPRSDQQSFYGLRYSEFVVPLVKAVQELSAKNDSLEQANAQLNQRLTQIEQLLGMGSGTQNGNTVMLTAARLFQNVPNPADQTTLISYYLPQTAGSAVIRISGMGGETIRSIAVNGTGMGQLQVQTTRLAPGTYLYSLIVDGNVVDTKKMVVGK